MSTPQRTLIGLDYELFFGSNAGTVQHCLIQPTEHVIQILSAYGAKLTLFVDAGFLVRLKDQVRNHPQLAPQLEAVQNQLRTLSRQGHDIQLHIHPHWEDSTFDGVQWKIDTRRYRLHDFSATEQLDLVARYKAVLEEVAEAPVFAYRAGGWCIQPFHQIAPALKANDIWLDSTVYANGVSNDPLRWFDFSAAPHKGYWRFSSSPEVEDRNGEFIEIPISSYPLSPFFYWKMAVAKKLAKDDIKVFGDGHAMTANAGYYLSRLFKTSHSPVSIDGIKADMLGGAYRHHCRYNEGGFFNIMGHPKSLTPYSLKKLDHFLSSHTTLEFITFQDLIQLRPRAD